MLFHFPGESRNNGLHRDEDLLLLRNLQFPGPWEGRLKLRFADPFLSHYETNIVHIFPVISHHFG